MTPTDVESREVIIGALTRGAPYLRQYLENIIVLPSYTVAELNSLFRYEIIRLTPEGVDTIELRAWLYPYPTVNDWVRYVHRHVIPFIKNMIRPTPSSYVVNF